MQIKVKLPENIWRNARTRERIDVAALGDSFTDAMTLPIDAAWTSRLERQTGLAVQHYGTAGFGPQQELLALKDYAARHHPRVVVLAYFAGNDLFDAEAFDDFDRSGGAIRRAVQGLANQRRREPRRYLVVCQRASRRGHVGLETRARGGAGEQRAGVGRDARGGARDDIRAGVRPGNVQRADQRPHAAVGVHAAVPEHAQLLRTGSRGAQGWMLTRQAIAEMRDVSRGIGAELVVVFLPFKSQVYLPLLERTFARAELTRALHFYLPDNPAAPDVAAMMRNRLAQNSLMRRFCAERSIPFLDTTGALQARFASGENVYFPDESRLNDVGHGVVADAVAAFLHR